jgi:malonate-semialdehyde dehydrogenase (acetylating) / methylmalonate-semialdehyde dehydrogenase
LKQAVNAASEAFKTWRKTSVVTRQAKMFQLQHLIRQNMDKLGALITKELGKTQADAKGDVLRGLRTLFSLFSFFQL